MDNKQTNYHTLEHYTISILPQNGHKRTFSFLHDDEKYWVKRPESGEANVWHKIMSIIAKLLNNRFFQPTVVTDPKASLANEAKRLRELKTNGINVPAVLVQSEEYLVLEDAGIPLSILLNDPATEIDEKKRLTTELSKALADMHNRGFYHSRPALRDIACKEGKIYFMDFEENLERTLTTEEAILRDGFLYVHTLHRKLRDPALAETALDVYRHALHPDLWNALVIEAQRYRFIYFLLKPLYRYLGKDGVAVFQTLHHLRRF